MLRRFALLAGLLAGGTACAQSDALRSQFTEALAAAEAGAPVAETPALRAYVLYPYIEAARLRTALRRENPPPDAAIEAFLAREPALPLSRELRRDWLNSLAARGRWAEFLQKDSPPSADLGLRCHRFQARLQTDGLAPEEQQALLDLWTVGSSLPQACVAPAQWLQSQGLLTLERMERRARLALEAGNAELAEWLIRPLPAATAAALQNELALLKEPLPTLQRLTAEPARPVRWEALREVFAKRARRNPEEVAALMPRLIAGRKLNLQQAGELRRDLAIGYALDRRPEALALFRDVPEPVLSDAAHEWRVRAALWQGDWALASEWLHLMPPALAGEDRWSYWRARAQEALGHTQQAESIYQTLVQQNGYYALLSAWRLDRTITPQSTPLPEDKAEQTRLLAKPALQRARELWKLQHNNWAHAEWRTAVQDEPVAAQAQAARLASEWGWHLQAVSVVNQLSLPADLSLLYPEAYTDEIRKAARYADIPPAWIYAVMRQESLFQPNAVSSAKAYGLLQLLLPTAQQVARKWQRPVPTREALFRPEVNLPLGAAYLRDMTDRFGGRFILTLAAYNAGPNAVARWLPATPKDADVWIENIPYNETRGYVQKILWHITAAGWRLDPEPQDPRPLLRQPVVAPGADAAAAPSGPGPA